MSPRLLRPGARRVVLILAAALAACSPDDRAPDVPATASDDAPQDLEDPRDALATSDPGPAVPPTWTLESQTVSEDGVPEGSAGPLDIHLVMAWSSSRDLAVRCRKDAAPCPSDTRLDARLVPADVDDIELRAVTTYAAADGAAVFQVSSRRERLAQAWVDVCIAGAPDVCVRYHVLNVPKCGEWMNLCVPAPKDVLASWTQRAFLWNEADGNLPSCASLDPAALPDASDQSTWVPMGGTWTSFLPSCEGTEEIRNLTIGVAFYDASGTAVRWACADVVYPAGQWSESRVLVPADL